MSNRHTRQHAMCIRFINLYERNMDRILFGGVYSTQNEQYKYTLCGVLFYGVLYIYVYCLHHFPRSNYTFYSDVRLWHR